MALKTFVKVTHITNLSDARYCAGMGVNQLGFHLVPSHPEFISTEFFTDLTGWIAGPELVGEFGNLDPSEIKEIQKSYPIDVIAYNNLTHTEALSAFGKPLQFIKHISAESDVQQLKGMLAYLDELAHSVVIKCGNPALTEEIDVQLNYYSGHLSLLKGYNIGTQIGEELHGFHGIEMAGTPEDRPGYKDYGLIMDVLEALEVEN